MDENRSKRTLPWMRILFVASLAFNLLIVGVFVGAKFTEDRHERRGPDAGARGLSVGPYGRALSKEDRAELRKSFMARKPMFDQTRRQMRAFGVEMAAAVRAEPFDPAVVTEILDRQRGVQISLQSEGQSLLVERLSSMTAAQRAAFASKLEKGMRRGKPNR